jgi:5-methylcytosine-specific restriction protein A
VCLRDVGEGRSARAIQETETMKRAAAILTTLAIWSLAMLWLGHQEGRHTASKPATVQMALAPEQLGHEEPRSKDWPRVRNAWIAEHPDCAVCGTKKNCEVHHKIPFHLHPELELNPANLITLCRVHHEWWGHLGNWKSFNKDVVEDAKIWKDKIKNRP